MDTEKNNSFAKKNSKKNRPDLAQESIRSAQHPHFAAKADLALMKRWHFHHGDLPRMHQTQQLWHKAGGAVADVDFSAAPDTTWVNVDLPHDWMTFDSVNADGDCASGYKIRSVGWYTKDFFLPDQSFEEAELVFDGVLGECKVYVNGVLAVRNFSGFNRFSARVEDYLLTGRENHLVVFVDATRGEGWAYEGAGIYRRVMLHLRSSLHLLTADCFVRSEKVDEKWMICADLATTFADVLPDVCSDVHSDDVCLDAEDISFLADALPMLSVTVTDPEGSVVHKDTLPAQRLAKLCIPVVSPKLWSPEMPNCYHLHAVLSQGEILLDSADFTIGLRNVKWVSGRGMLLNGVRYPIKGICCHQDHAGVGAAVTEEIVEFRIARLKSFGINAYRCAHNAPDELLLQVCDRMGMLVMSENRHFDTSDETLRQVEAMVKVSRNHPCVFLYSLFNEEPWQGEIRGKKMAIKLMDYIRPLDPTRAITGAQNSGILTDDNTTQCLDIVGLNYNLKTYDRVHRLLPDKVILGTENCPTYATRGELAFDPEKQVYADTAERYADHFAESMEETMAAAFGSEYVAGCFVWSGFEHRGEPSPWFWPSVLSHWGIMDSCGFPKATAYLLQSYYQDEPMVHLCLPWQGTKGELVRVPVISNCDTVSLSINGQLIRTASVTEKRCCFEIPYTPGVLRALGKKSGLQVTDELHSAGEAHSLQITEAGTQEKAIHIFLLQAVDAQGFPADSARAVKLSVTSGRILGLGNGDPNGHQPEKGEQVFLFHGKAQVIVDGANAAFSASL